MSTENEVLTTKVSYNKRDLIIYALGIGAHELKYVHEGDSEFQLLPTFPFVLPFKGTSSDVVTFPSEAMMDTNVLPPIDGTRVVLDGERHLTIYKPLPIDGGTFLL